MQEIRAAACRRRASVSGRARLAALAGLTAVVASAGIVRAQDDTAQAFPTAIGDSARDLLFTPVPRCRVLDTRVAGEPLIAGVPRAFDVAGPLAGQGGAADCLVPFGPATAVVLNLTVVQGRVAGTLTAGPSGAALPDTSVLSFNPRRRAAIVSNEVTLPICDASVSACDHDLVVVASGETHLVADVAGYYSRVPAVTVPWSSVSGKPPGFADNLDNDTQYSAGAGLLQTGTVFHVDSSALQSRVTGTCAAGSAIRAIGPTGTVTCQSDTNTTYTAAPAGGLSISGTSFSVANLGITGGMLASGAVGTGKIANGAVGSTQIADRSVLTADIAEGAITAMELSSFAVGLNKIASGVVGQSEIATDGVGAAEIATNAVGADEIAAGAVGRSEIDGTERAIYSMRAACHADGITTSSTCTTPLCTPFPVPLFWSCGNNCDSLVPLQCDNILLGYLLSPNIE